MKFLVGYGNVFIHPPDLDILESTSCYIPVPHSEENSFADSHFDFNTLTTSLTQAYGISDPAETSQILSSLVGNDRENLGFIQGWSLTADGDVQMHKMELPSVCETTKVSTTADRVESSQAISQSQNESRHQGAQLTSQLDATDPVPPNLLAQEKSPDPGNNIPSAADPPNQVLSWDTAATRIQSAVRGYFARKRLQPYIQQQRAATVIQAAWYICKN